MRYVHGKTFAEAYKNLLIEVYNHYEYETAPRGMNIREILNCAVTIENPYSNLFKNEVRDLPMKYLKKELALYLSGRNDVEGFGEASKFWKKIANEDGTINSAYGNLIFKMDDTPNKFTQWRWALYSLIQDKDSRQAVMHFNRPAHQYLGVKDFPCTLEMIFHIRDNKLNATTVMRSNDVIKGTTFDIPFFMLVQQMMLNALKKVYPELEMGTYTHLAHSMHLYESDFELVGKMLEKEFVECEAPRITHAAELLDNTDIVEGITKGTKYGKSTQFSENNEFIHWLCEGI